MHVMAVIIKSQTLTQGIFTVKANRLCMSLYIEWSSKLFHPYQMNSKVILLHLNLNILKHFKINNKQKLQKSWKDLFRLNILDDAALRL